MKIDRALLTHLAFVATLLLSGCGYNPLQRADEQAKASWAEVVNQYQRRADLVPNLVKVVQGQADFERETVVQVVEARSRATAIEATPELFNDPQAFRRFQQAQRELSSSLSRLLVVAENYPALRANQGFLDLQAQLEGTENRITVARERYIRSIQDYNGIVRAFPSNLTAMLFGYQLRASFSVDNEDSLSRPPPVEFGPRSAEPAPNGAKPK